MQCGTKEMHSLYLSIFFVTVCFGQDFANDNFFNPPLLNANETFIELKSRSKLEFVCEGQYPLLWKIHSANVDKDIRLIEVSSVNISQPINKYKSSLTLEDLNFKDTGFYFCYYEGTRNFDSAHNVTSIYVFVNDRQHLFVNISLFDTELLVPVRLNREILIPCLPTSSRVNVTLWKTDSREEHSLVTLGTHATFDPTRGFSISTRKFWSFKRFQCRAYLDNVYEEINVTMKFLPDAGQYPYSPTISMKQPQDIVVNGSFILLCSVEVMASGTLVYVDWTYPGKYKKTSRKFYPHKNALLSKKWNFQMDDYLTVTQAQTSDSGIYTCSMTDFWNRTGRAAIKIPVYNLADDHFFPPFLSNINEPFIELHPYIVQEIICVGKYPLLWKKKDSKVDLNDTRFITLPSVDLSQPVNKYKSNLTLKNLNVNDTGFYSCYYEGTDNFDSADNITSLYVLVQNPEVYTIHPVIDSSFASHAVVGEVFVLKCSVDMIIFPSLNWITPNENEFVLRLPTKVRLEEEDNSRVMVERNYYQWNMTTKVKVESYLIVREARTSDSGIYTCATKDYLGNSGRAEFKLPVYCSANDNFFHPPVLNINETFMDLKSNSTLEIICVGKYPVLWKFGSAKITRNGPRLFLQSSVNMTQPLNKYKSTLTLEDLDFKDTGFYSCYYEGTKDLKCADNVTSVYVFVNDPLHLFVEQSLIDGVLFVPIQEDGLTIIPCSPTSSRADVTLWRTNKEVGHYDAMTDGAFEEEYTLMSLNTDAYYDPTSGFMMFSPASFDTWNFQCRAYLENAYEEINVTLRFKLDTEHNLQPMIDMSEAQNAVVNETFTLKCMVNVKKNLLVSTDWTYPNKNEEGFRITHKSESIHLNMTDEKKLVTYLTVADARTSDSGTYICFVAGPSIITRSAEVSIIVYKIEVPLLTNSNMNGTFIQIIAGSLHKFFCYVDGVPFPTVTWKKDGMTLDATNMSGVELTDMDQKLKIRKATEEDAGFYECIAMNTGGQIVANATLEILEDNADAKDHNNITAIIIGAVALILCISFFFCCRWLILYYKKKRELAAELVNIAGNMTNSDRNNIFNPNLPVEDQIDLLPYNDVWEFPKERLKLGKILGQGMFGRVLKAEAIGLVDGEASSTVAVKMLKKGAGKDEWKALVAELKILIHIGKNLNIVNLLGAVTNNISKGEMYVIVEFCCYGNLRHFLLKHKTTFIDQLDHRTGQLDTKISSAFSNTLQPVHYADIAHDQATNYSGMGTSVLTNPSYSEQECQYYNTSLPQAECGSESSASATGNNRFVTTCDLINFSFQCARGMEYLESRKLLHRDLAARNVLLAKDNIVKICDFGLAKDCYKYSNYIKKSDGLLPIKWMAIESIKDRIFTSKTDVWSFGIFLWEIFTLGCSPYPGMEINEEFFEKLERGYRMEKPDFAPDLIYNLMKSCWLRNPNQRPDFKYLAENIGALLESSVREHYKKLNEPYELMNRDILKNDYLQMTRQTQEHYTNMVDSSEQQLNPDEPNPVNAYENVTLAWPVEKLPVGGVSMQVAPMIQFKTFSNPRKTGSHEEERNELRSEKSVEYDGAIDTDGTYLNMGN